MMYLLRKSLLNFKSTIRSHTVIRWSLTFSKEQFTGLFCSLTTYMHTDFHRHIMHTHTCHLLTIQDGRDTMPFVMVKRSSYICNNSDKLFHKPQLLRWHMQFQPPGIFFISPCLSYQTRFPRQQPILGLSCCLQTRQQLALKSYLC